MPIQNSDRPRPRTRGLGIGAAGALLRAAGALPKNSSTERKPRMHPSRQDEALKARGVQADVPKVAEAKEQAASTEVRVPKTANLQTEDRASEIVEDETHQAHTEFLEFCLGGPAAVLEVEIQRATEECKETHEEYDVEDCQSVNQIFCADSDKESDDDNPDLEDMFGFDPARLAELMNKGASLDELTEHLQDAYADALEQRIGSPKCAADNTLEEEHTRTMGTDISQLMTPEQVTPVETPTGNQDKLLNESFTDCAASLVENMRCAEDRKRRSIAVQQRPSAAHRRDSAVKSMEAFGRRSLALIQDATADEQALLSGAVSDAMRRASRRHRRSVTMATEVLEEVANANTLPLDEWPDDQIDSKVELIQNAMDEAYKRHTQGITDAVKHIVHGKGATPLSQEKHAKDLAVQERIAKAVSGAYQRKCDQWDVSNHQQYHSSQHVQWSGYEQGWQDQLIYNEQLQAKHASDPWQWKQQERWSQYKDRACEVQWNQDWQQGGWHAPTWSPYATGSRAPWRYGSA